MEQFAKLSKVTLPLVQIQHSPPNIMLRTKNKIYSHCFSGDYNDFYSTSMHLLKSKSINYDRSWTDYLKCSNSGEGFNSNSISGI